jgi:hypothetical protein
VLDTILTVTIGIQGMEETYRVQVLRLIVSFISITRIVVLLVLGIRTLVTLTRVLIWIVIHGVGWFI